MPEQYLPTPAEALYNAAKVIQLTPHIRAYLLAHDPMALQALEAAIKMVEGAK